jgi:plastocyanin
VPDPTAPARSPRRAAAALVLTLGLGLVAGCSGDGDAGGTAADTSAADTPTADTSAAAPSSSAAASPPSSPAAEPPAEAETVAVTEREMVIELSEDSYSPGSYTFEVVNEGRMPHDFVVERDGADVAATDILQPGESATLTVTLEPGDYVFYCSVGSHRAAGMETPVTVGA